MMVLSAPPEAKRFPSREYATQYTASLWPAPSHLKASRKEIIENYCPAGTWSLPMCLACLSIRYKHPALLRLRTCWSQQFLWSLSNDSLGNQLSKFFCPMPHVHLTDRVHIYHKPSLSTNSLERDHHLKTLDLYQCDLHCPSSDTYTQHTEVDHMLKLMQFLLSL